MTYRYMPQFTIEMKFPNPKTLKVPQSPSNTDNIEPQFARQTLTLIQMKKTN